jgi:hypothetical protein
MFLIINCVLLLLVSGYIFLVFESFRGIGEILADEFQVNYLYSIETFYNNNEERFNKIDSVAQKMIRYSPENLLEDSAKQILEPLFAELFPVLQDSLDSFIYFYPKFIQINMMKPKHQSDSTKTCYWGYVWISVSFIDDSEEHWVGFNKIDGDYSTTISIHKWHIPKNRGWYFYREGCD